MAGWPTLVRRLCVQGGKTATVYATLPARSTHKTSQCFVSESSERTGQNRFGSGNARARQGGTEVSPGPPFGIAQDFGLGLPLRSRPIMRLNFGCAQGRLQPWVGCVYEPRAGFSRRHLPNLCRPYGARILYETHTQGSRPGLRLFRPPGSGYRRSPARSDSYNVRCSNHANPDQRFIAGEA